MKETSKNENWGVTKEYELDKDLISRTIMHNGGPSIPSYIEYRINENEVAKVEIVKSDHSLIWHFTMKSGKIIRLPMHKSSCVPVHGGIYLSRTRIFLKNGEYSVYFDPGDWEVYITKTACYEE